MINKRNIETRLEHLILAFKKSVSRSYVPRGIPLRELTPVGLLNKPVLDVLTEVTHSSFNHWVSGGA